MKRFFDPTNNRFYSIAALLGVLLVFVFCLFVPHAVVFAADTPLQQVGAASGLPQTSLPILIARIIRVVISVIGIILVVLIIWAGFLYMNAQGDAAKVDKAKKIIMNAVIGVVLTLSSYSIASFILGRLLQGGAAPAAITSIAKKYVEPLAGSLGAGAIENHMPSRDATGVPRNTKIFVTFKDSIKASTIVKNYKDGCTYVVANPQTTPLCSTELNTDAVRIYETNKGSGQSLAIKQGQENQVVVTVSEDKRTFVFKPKDYLGSPNKDTQYSVELLPVIQKTNGEAVFTGTQSKGYNWNFTVSTTVDLTPPKVVSVIPVASGTYDRNITVEVTFNEPMDPISSTGSYKLGDANKKFQNITVSATDVNKNTKLTDGTFVISSDYRSIDFTSTSWCGKDPCGGDIYCLDPNAQMTVTAKSASIDTTNPPQALLANGVNYDGLVDAAGNTLDGNGDGQACGSDVSHLSGGVCANGAKCTSDTDCGSGSCQLSCAAGKTNDDYSWSFNTTNNVNDHVPQIESIVPKMNADNIDTNADIILTFDSLMKASTINSQNVSIWPDPYYSMWFTTNKIDIPNGPNDKPSKSEIHIAHPAFVSAIDCNVVNGAGSACSYWPVVTKGVQSAYQICMFPAMAANTSCVNNTENPYCCSGQPSKEPCKTGDQKTLPQY